MTKWIKVLFILTNLGMSSSLSSQDLSTLFFPDKNISYLGQTSPNRKEKNGMGIQKLKKGAVYVGDFSRNEAHGHGMLIVPQNQTIDKCGEATVYVGKWFRGKMEGKGKLYNKKGELIYNGSFSENVPQGDFLNKQDTISKFSILEIENELFIGETIDDVPNGFGIFLDDEGFFTVCPVNYGLKNGVGIMILPPYKWMIFNIENELYYPIVSSIEYEERQARYKINRSREKAELLNTFSSLINEGLELTSNFVNTYSPTNDIDIENNSSFASDFKNKNNASNSNENSISNQTNYNSDKATYSKYDSLLSAVFAGNRDASSSEIKNWQSKMKALRTKWEKAGKSFPHSSNEDR